MMKVGRVMDTLKKDHPKLYEQIVPLFVTVDPARDSIQALKAYAKDLYVLLKAGALLERFHAAS